MKIIAAIVTFNRKEMLNDCINALLKQSVVIDKILVIDNNSQDGTEILMSAIVSENENIVYKRMNSNTGGAGGFRQAAESAYNMGADWIWLMDDDVVPKANCLEKMLKINKDYGYKILQPNRIYMNSDKALPVALNWNYNLLKNNELVDMRIFHPKKDNQVVEIASMPFEGPLISREVIEKVGLPDSDYFIFYDDTDYSMRAKMSGYKIILCPNAIIERQVVGNNQSTTRFSFSWRDYYLVRNSIYFYKKYKFKYSNFKLSVQFIKFNIRALLSIKSFNIRSYRLFLKSYIDGFRGVRKKEIDF